MILFKNCNVYAPEFLGAKDVLTAGTRIIAIADHIGTIEGVDESD